MKEAFISYLIDRGYTQYTSQGMPSTVYQYAKCIEDVMNYENYYSWQDVVKNIDRLLSEYDIGGIKERLGQKRHNSVISVLRRFSEFLHS